MVLSDPGLQYSIASFPPYHCLPSDENATFYSFVLPLIILILIGGIMAVFLVQQLHKVLIVLLCTLYAIYLSLILYSHYPMDHLLAYENSVIVCNIRIIVISLCIRRYITAIL